MTGKVGLILFILQYWSVLPGHYCLRNSSHVCFLSCSPQYPGVGDSIDSDINNLMTVLKVSNLLPEGNYHPVL